jgi:hypothetical protein
MKLAPLAGWVALALTACAPSRPPLVATVDSLEERLLGAREVHVHFHSTCEGRYSGELEGSVDDVKGDIDVSAKGTFMGEPATAVLHADASHMSGGGAKRFDQPRPRALEEGLFVALARMGLLHNLTMLTDGEPPDATDGSAKAWVVVDSQRDAGIEGKDGHKAHRLEVAIHVVGASKADGQLWLDDSTGLPVARALTVHFEKGDMRVVETYDRFEVSP